MRMLVASALYVSLATGIFAHSQTRQIGPNRLSSQTGRSGWWIRTAIRETIRLPNAFSGNGSGPRPPAQDPA